MREVKIDTRIIPLSAMSLQDQVFNLKFSSKQLQRESKKFEREEKKEKEKVKKVRTRLLAAFNLQALVQGNKDIAKVYAENAIRMKTQQLTFLRLASRLDAVASRLDLAVTMNSVQPPPPARASSRR
jgi:charged multivesicular body protein 1